jgi:hypothetical protein
MNKTLALSAILISLSIIMIGSIIIMSLPEVNGFFYNLCGFILMVTFPGLIATFIALYKSVKE